MITHLLTIALYAGVIGVSLLALFQHITVQLPF